MRRYECKYLLHNSLLPEIRALTRPFVVHDSYAARNNGQYTVRSIYFDTPRLLYYREKIEGLQMRKKLRIRGYNTQGPDSQVFLEIKRRFGVPIAKNRAPLYYRDLGTLIHTGDIDRYILRKENMPNALDDANRFLYNLYRYSMRPVVTVVYDREAYVGKFDPSVRVTFDKQLRSEIFPRLGNLFSDSNLTYAFKSHFILEIKYYGSLMPSWARSIVGILSAHQQALSKYTISIDSHDIPIRNLSTTLAWAHTYVLDDPPECEEPATESEPLPAPNFEPAEILQPSLETLS